MAKETVVALDKVRRPILEGCLGLRSIMAINEPFGKTWQLPPCFPVDIEEQIMSIVIPLIDTKDVLRWKLRVDVHVIVENNFEAHKVGKAFEVDDTRVVFAIEIDLYDWSVILL
ncbi:hypothetical protein VNO80_13449 [Phaseolus coccineus]|uniref:Uncharacterized protein n=1 Tax=Phaseolus coccineus TaxID=3886 RepID=A0AAN9N678_PHACN